MPIELKRGMSNTTVSDKVRGDEEAEYVFAGKQGQRLVVTLTSSPRRSSCFTVVGPDRVNSGPMDCKYDYVQTLPKSGDYFITVSRTNTGAGTSSFKLAVTAK